MSERMSERMTKRITALPTDIRRLIYDGVCRLRKPKKVLPVDLKRDIETYGLFGDIKADHESCWGDDVLDWLENSLINVMNDDIGLLNGVSADMRNAYPNRTEQEILSYFVSPTSPSQVKRLWTRMPSHKRTAMHRTLTPLSLERID